MKHRSANAKSLATAKFRARVIPNKKKYDRKKKPRDKARGFLVCQNVTTAGHSAYRLRASNSCGRSPR